MFNLNIPLILVLIFHAIVFLQSGLDKLFNWKGNLDFTTQTLSKTFSNQSIKLALLIVLVLETVGGLLSFIGLILNIVNSDCVIYGQIGLISCNLALLVLLFGQRLSQNYDGAKTIAIYFTVSLIGLVLIFN
tara:strand:- start:352 stop:747 length:396 start_codon:yes stop_codon:yes gene_type:complete